MAKRKTIPPEVRQELYEEFDGRCGYCGTELNTTWHADHITPVRKGGGDERDNLIASCISCNLAKNSLSIEQFRNHLERKHDQLLRDESKYRQLIRYGIIKKVKPEVTFYFEKHFEENTKN